MRTTPEQRLALRGVFDLDSEVGQQVIALLDDHDDLNARISKAIDIGSGAGWVPPDEVREMLAILGDPDPMPTYCAYCGHRVAGDDDAASVIAEHIAKCEKHPMRRLEQRWFEWYSTNYLKARKRIGPELADELFPPGPSVAKAQ